MHAYIIVDLMTGGNIQGGNVRGGNVLLPNILCFYTDVDCFFVWTSTRL